MYIILSIIVILIILFFYYVVKVQDNIENKIPSPFKLYYIKGIDELDSYRSKEVNLSFSPDKKFRASKMNCSFELPFDKIKTVEVKEIDHLIEEEKSIISRALVGGFIAGPIGAIVGGMTGIHKKTKEHKVFFFILTTIYDKKIIFLLKDLYPTLRSRLAEYKAYISRNIESK